MFTFWRFKVASHRRKLRFRSQHYGRNIAISESALESGSNSLFFHRKPAGEALPGHSYLAQSNCGTTVTPNDIEFPFHNQEAIVSAAVRLLAVVEPPQSCCLVIPPGFGSHTVARQVAGRLRERSPLPLLAEIEADAVVDVNHFVTELHAGWLNSLACSLNVSPDEARKTLPIPSSALPAHEALKALLDSLPTDRPVIAVLARFHKILDRLDQWVLAQLRATEEKRRLRTVTISPLPYAELKKRWRENHPLTVSDYGDKHAIFKAEVGPLAFAQERCEQLSVPDHLVRHMLLVAGGYPEPMIAMLEEWHRRGRTKELRPEVKQAYRDAAERQVERLIDWLDADKEDTPICEAIIDLYQGIDEERAEDRLCGHPYEPFLLNSDGGLRAECVGGLPCALPAVGRSTSSQLPVGFTTVAFMHKPRGCSKDQSLRCAVWPSACYGTTLV
jgi:hypothetical protein